MVEKKQQKGGRERMKSTRRRQLAGDPHDNMCTKLALRIIFILCLEQALSFAQQKRGKEEGEHKKAENGKKKKRAVNEESRILDAFTCEEGRNKMVKMPSHADCTKEKEKEALVEWSGEFALLQKRRTKDVNLLSCVLKVSIFDGHCGVWAHWSWSDVPYVKENLLISLEECVRAHRQGKVRVGGELHRVEMGTNTKRVVEKGSLVYDPSGQSYSCTNEPGRQTSDQKKHLKSELKMTVYEVVLGQVPGRMRTDTNRIVVAGGAHEGIEITPLEVQAGGRERDGVTFVVDHPEELNRCPFAILRRKVELKQYHFVGEGFGEPKDSFYQGEETDLAGIALIGEQVAIKLEAKEPLPASCLEVGRGGANVYKTNHEGILAVHLVPGVDLQALDKNGVMLQEMDLDVTTASRLDLLSYHISSALRNLSLSVDQGLCLSQLQEMSQVMNVGTSSKTRVLPAGEVVVISECEHLLVEYGRVGNSSFSSECPTYLPVTKMRKGRGEEMTQWWLEPKTRYIYRESPRKPCGLTKILPIWFELRSGRFISFNGEKFAAQSVEEYTWMNKKRYFSEAGIDVWKDLDAQGMLTEKKMLDLDIWQEYSIYLTRKSAVDQGKGSHDKDSPLTRASGTAVRSWMHDMKSATGRLLDKGMEAAVDEMGLSGVEHLVKELEGLWARIQGLVGPLGTIGGAMYLVQKVMTVVINLVMFWCTKQGNQVDDDYKVDKSLKWCWSCFGCGGKVAQACGICTLEVCCGDRGRKKAILERTIKDLIDKEMLETRAHLRDVAFVDERRRESKEHFELAALVTQEPGGK